MIRMAIFPVSNRPSSRLAATPSTQGSRPDHGGIELVESMLGVMLDTFAAPLEPSSEPSRA